MNKKKRIDTESDEYLTWKQGSVPVEQPPEPIISEPIIEESPELKRRKIFFLDWFFGITTHKGQMKMMYYLFTFFFYYLFCVVMTYFLERMPELNIGSIIFLAFLAIFVALALPFVLLIMGFTLSGGIFIGMFVGIFSWLFGLGGRFLYKLFGYDMELLFPEFIGKKGEITKYSIFKFSAYPYAATISKMGLPGDSFLYKNNFSVRSDEELNIGMKIEVIKHEKWSITSLMKNHPTFVVRILDEEIMVGNSEINNLNK